MHFLAEPITAMNGGDRIRKEDLNVKLNWWQREKEKPRNGISAISLG